MLIGCTSWYAIEDIFMLMANGYTCTHAMAGMHDFLYCLHALHSLDDMPPSVACYYTCLLNDMTSWCLPVKIRVQFSFICLMHAVSTSFLSRWFS